MFKQTIATWDSKIIATGKSAITLGYVIPLIGCAIHKNYKVKIGKGAITLKKRYSCDIDEEQLINE